MHGFGFSFVLEHTLQFAGSHLLTSLLAFNVGVELGQLLVLVICVPLLNLLFKHVVAERLGTIILSAIVAHQAWHWMIERFGVLAVSFRWPDDHGRRRCEPLRWLLALVAVAAVMWLIFVVTQRPAKRAAGEPAE